MARNGKGEVWQRPGAPRDNADIDPDQDPTDRYPNGCVRFNNSYNQPLDVDGKPTGKGATHIRIKPDGTYPIPKGWNP